MVGYGLRVERCRKKGCDCLSAGVGDSQTDGDQRTCVRCVWWMFWRGDQPGKIRG